MLSEEIEKIVEKYEVEIKRLEDLWQSYREAARTMVNSWIRERVNIIAKISELEGLLKSYENELKELEVKYEIGVINEEELTRKTGPLIENMRILRDTLDKLKESLKRIDEIMIIHALQAKLPMSGGSLNDIKKKLKALKELYEKGQIRKEVYEKLKLELEMQERILQESLEVIKGTKEKGLG